MQDLILDNKQGITKFINDTINFMNESDAAKPLDEISCWMDQIKDSGGMKWTGQFHYTDIPLIEDNITINVKPEGNVTGAIVLLF